MNSSKKRGVRTGGLLLAVGLTTFACGGRLSSTRGDDPIGESPSPSGTLPSLPSTPPTSTAAVAPAPTSKPIASGCTTDSDCDDQPNVGPSLGTCWPGPAERDARGGSCLCREGAFLQRPGRCGTTPPPSCVAQGGSCVAWTTCAETNGHPSDGHANDECSADGSSTCCVPDVICKQTSITFCYRRGTDGAYVPPCINGWVTCHPGDSPALQIP